MTNSYSTYNPPIYYAVLCVWILSLLGLLFYVDQSSFFSIATFYASAFACYYYFIRHSASFLLDPNKALLFSAIAIRIVAIFAFPALSDDIYRFVWDGRLAAEGFHPFEHLPSYYLEEGNEVRGITAELFEQLNSQNYYTIYPTISQWVFTFSAWLFPDSIYGFSISMKGILAFTDIGTIFIIRHLLIRHFDWNVNRSLIYALNPLVIIEVCGNGHFEGAMIFFFVLSFYFFLRDSRIRNQIISSLFLGAAIASKMLPLMFLPLLLAVLSWKKAFRYYIFTGIWLVVLFAPMLSANVIEHLGESLNLYFQKFEFNASIYYIVRWIGYQVKGWNIIQDAGPILGMIVFIAVWLLTFFNWKSKGRDKVHWAQMAMWALTIYLSLATIVHPWYITTLVALSIFTNYRYPLLWSGLIVLTYINYSYDSYFENLWVVGVEYLLVFGMLIYEIKKSNFTNPDKLSGGSSFKVKATNSI